MKYAGCGAAGYEPRIPRAKSNKAGAACGKSAFIRQRCRQAARMQRRPGFPIGSTEKKKLAIYRIADSDAMLAIPEGKAVVKGFGLLIGELKLPVLAAVFRFVDAGLLSRPGSQNESGF